MKLSNIYHLDSVNEAIDILESKRSLDDYQSGEPDRIARTNIWTELKRHAIEIKEKLEAEEKSE